MRGNIGSFRKSSAVTRLIVTSGPPSP
jgi:hypothetical protein